MSDETTTELTTDESAAPELVDAELGGYFAMCDRCGWSMTGDRAEVIRAGQEHECTPPAEPAPPADEPPAAPAPDLTNG
jgi:hypothetical protein